VDYRNTLIPAARATMTALAVSALMLGCGSSDDTATQGDASQTTNQETGAPMSDNAANEIAIMETDFGDITIDFLEDVAPKHAENFKRLAREGFYDGISFHRVIPGFIIQAGDPLSKDQTQRARHGTGGPGYTIPAEISALHGKGVLAAARTPDQANPQRRSSGSQFYITLAPTPNLDHQYTVYGEVTDGMDVALKIADVQRDPRDNPVDPILIKTIRIEDR
jgi:peptidyl-prolyl cis-trans isomerase B (cyclophilin B)